MYLPYGSRHAKPKITNYVKGELKRHVRVNIKLLNFLNIKLKFHLRLHNRGFMNRLFSQVSSSLRTEYLRVKNENPCCFQNAKVESWRIRTLHQVL